MVFAITPLNSLIGVGGKFSVQVISAGQLSFSSQAKNSTGPRSRVFAQVFLDALNQHFEY